MVEAPIAPGVSQHLPGVLEKVHARAPAESLGALKARKPLAEHRVGASARITTWRDSAYEI